MQITPLLHPAGYYISPLTINQDGSMNGVIRYGVLIPSAEEGGAPSFHQLCEQGQWLSAADAAPVLATAPNEAEGLKDALERGFAEALRRNGTLIS